MIKVTAIEKGYYGNKVRVPGEVFGITDPSHFSKEWMVTDDPIVHAKLDPLDHDDDGKKGGAKKAPAVERIKLASELSGRTDIKTAKEADEIIAAAGGDDAPGNADDGDI